MLHDYIAFQNLSTKFQTHFFLQNSAFFSKFRSQNFNKKCAQNAGNRISEALGFKIFRGRIPDPLLMRGFGVMHQSAHTLDPPLMISHSCSILSNYIFCLFIEVQSKWWSDFIEHIRNPGPSARCSRSNTFLAILKTQLRSSKQPRSILASLPPELQNIIIKENIEIQVSMHLMLLMRKKFILMKSSDKSTTFIYN